MNWQISFCCLPVNLNIVLCCFCTEGNQKKKKKLRMIYLKINKKKETKYQKYIENKKKEQKSTNQYVNEVLDEKWLKVFVLLFRH